MKSKILCSIAALVLVISALGLSVSPAFADAPVKIDYVLSWSSIVSGVCQFDFEVASVFTLTEISYFDKTGAVIRAIDHVVEQDTLTANGKSLPSLPYSYNQEWVFDSSGNLISQTVYGILLKIPLPDGTLYNAAGKTILSNHPGTFVFLTPDFGTPDRTAKLCAALAP